MPQETEITHEPPRKQPKDNPYSSRTREGETAIRQTSLITTQQAERTQPPGTPTPENRTPVTTHAAKYPKEPKSQDSFSDPANNPRNKNEKDHKTPKEHD